MKLKLFIGLTALISSGVMSAILSSPIDGVSVNATENSVLSIQNLSSRIVKVDIYGEKLTILPISGVLFNCSNLNTLELILDGMVYDYFEVPCKSRVIINDSFQPQI